MGKAWPVAIPGSMPGPTYGPRTTISDPKSHSAPSTAREERWGMSMSSSFLHFEI